MIRSKIASRFERAKTMGFFWAWIILALHLWPFAPMASAQGGQGSRKDDIVFNSRGVPLAGASVRVCTMPATGQPCTPLALIYSDAALTQALANPTTTDGLGNYFFYAAPGKYEIEISGPGITTRQIPNVILPSDPTAPSFSSVASTGAISAFSLNLSGNLSVTGNAAVSGSLAGGTLNLANQSTPPGAASAGTVNFYTKTADKRLYYKDDSGTEIGPVANTTGAQTNVTNTFTAPQNFDADVHSKGPNPWFDVTRYGAVASAQTTTGSMTSGSATLTLASAIDFANGQGIVVYQAGSATALTTPGTPAVAPQGAVVNGATTYNYQVACEDYSGGLTAASSTGSTTVGPAALGAQPTISISSWARASGVLTFTTASAHNLTVGFPVNITGESDNSVNGMFTVASVPTATTFTISQSTAPDSSGGSGTLQGLAYNKVTWTPSAGGSILRCWIYRNTALVGVQPGIDGYYEDYGVGLSANSAPPYVPATPPSSAQAGYLATTISSGGGTTSLTLAASASTTVSSKTVLHDNVPALNAATQAAIANNLGYTSGTVYVPNNNTGSAFPPAFQINSAWQMPSVGSNFVTYIIAGGLQVSQPILLASNVSLEGLPGSPNQSQTPSFAKGGYAVIVASGPAGGGFPFFYVPLPRSNITLRRINVYGLANQQVGFWTDEASDGSGSTDIFFDHVYYSMGVYGQAERMAGGFGFYHDNTGFGTQNAVFGSPYAVRLTSENYTTTGAIPDIDYFTNCWFGGTGIVIDNVPKTSLAGATGNVQIQNVIYESGRTPLLRVNVGGNIFISEIELRFADVADFAGGWATPEIDSSNTTNLTSATCIQCSTLNSNMPIWVGNPAQLFIQGFIPGTAGVGSANYVSLNSGTATTGPTTNGTVTFLDMHGAPILSTNRFVIPMSPPAAPGTPTVSAGGSLAIGTYTFKATAVDWDGNESAMSLASPSATTTSGNQTITLPLPAIPAGAQGMNIYYNINAGGFGRINTGQGSCNSPMYTTGSTNVTGSTSGFTGTCGNIGPATLGTAALAGLSSNGVSTSQLRVGGDALITAAPRAEQSVFLPGALTSTWTGATWTLDKAITMTRIEVQAKTAPSGCTTNAVVRLTDGTSPVNVTISAAANTSGAIAQNYAAGSAITVAVQTAAAGCSTSPADANVVVQYRMQ